MTGWLARRLTAWAQTPTDHELHEAFAGDGTAPLLGLGVEDRARLWFRRRAGLTVRQVAPWSD